MSGLIAMLNPAQSFNMIIGRKQVHVDTYTPSECRDYIVEVNQRISSRQL